MSMRAHGFGLAHVGQKRQSNQDCWLADDQLGLYVVADGMGGHRGGELAAATAVDAVAQIVRARREVLGGSDQGADPKRLGLLVDSACQAASQAVFDRAAQGDAANARMGCTLTVLLVTQGWGVMGHVGDSRLYLSRKGSVQQVSEDHTFPAELARAGALKPADVRAHPYAHVLTRSVGTHPAVNADILAFPLLPEDRILLCSDGLSNYLRAPEMLVKELAEEDLEGIPAELVRHANASGGADNITALVVGIEFEPDSALLSASELVQANLGALEDCFLFSGLSFARKAWVLSHCALLEPGEGPLFQEGDTLPGLLLVVSGTLRIERGGKALGSVGSGEHLGSAALLRARPARATVSAEGPCRLLRITPASFRTLVRARPRLGALLLRRLSTELADALEPWIANDPNPAPNLAP